MIIKAPNYVLNKVSVFLAGSINQGKTEDWQTGLGQTLSHDYDFLVFNPRREDWDASWGQEDERLREQINWELEHLEACDAVIFYFASKELSPVSLLELGLMINSGKYIAVICDKEYPRFANVWWTCVRYNIPFYQKIEHFLSHEGTKLTELATTGKIKS